MNDVPDVFVAIQLLPVPYCQNYVQNFGSLYNQ